ALARCALRSSRWALTPLQLSSTSFVSPFQNLEMAKQELGDWELQKPQKSSKNSVYTRRKGCDIIRNPLLNKGLAFTLEERLQLGIHGLLPPCIFDQNTQVVQVLKNYERKKDDLDRYIFLIALQDRNEKLFYRVLASDIERFMPIVYTPTVGLACQQYGLAFRRPRGLFITIHDRGHIATLLKSWPENDVQFAQRMLNTRPERLGKEICSQITPTNPLGANSHKQGGLTAH
ncbi:hypothetical protein scyTo_0003582, partial [Scyliorhinus torazame]|nr:hypothetical protein [Scyliorhinus torazame]